MKRKIAPLLLSAGFFLNGCSCLTEPPRKIWGSSTQTLERQRSSNALSLDVACTVEDCFETILNLVKEGEYQLFIQDRKKLHVIVMGVKGNVNTTEVGIFLDDHNGGVQVDVTSLSSSAKEKVADFIFFGLKDQFGDS